MRPNIAREASISAPTAQWNASPETRAATGVRLTTGGIIPADMVIRRHRIVPAVEPLIAAGAAASNGVEVDRSCRTSLPNIYAVGDCAAHANAFAGGAMLRLESVQNATDQANVAAKTILGSSETYDSVPWFWSTQYDLNCRLSALSAGHDDSTWRRTRRPVPSHSIYLREGPGSWAHDCVNRKWKDLSRGGNWWPIALQHRRRSWPIREALRSLRLAPDLVEDLLDPAGSAVDSS
jgi:hypothetical protein